MLTYLNKHIDKVVHFLGGFFIAVVIAKLSGVTEYGIIAAILIGITKEIYDDQSGKGTPEWLDATATIVGGYIGFIVMGQMMR